MSEYEARILAEKSLKQPINTQSLHRLAAGKQKVVILITDKTRATPNKLLVKALLSELREAGVKKDNIEVLVATGLHKPHTRSEIEELVGAETSDEYNVDSHNSDEHDSMIYLGKTAYGTEVYVNKSVVSADLVIGVGLIEPHFFAGYSGGRKLILPGVSATKTVYQNHGYRMLSHPKADYGYLEGNPVHEDMVEASKLVRNYKFITHVLLDKEKRVFSVVSGGPYSAHEQGVRILDRYVKVHAPFEADLTIVTNGGYPLDRDLYQTVKGMVTASRVTRRNGYIIMLSECIDGVGHESFRELASMSRNPEDILRYIKENEPTRDQWEAQKLAQVLLKNKVILVTRNIKHEVLEEMNLTHASTFEEAFETACKSTSCNHIIAIPEGPYVIPVSP
uniref:Nickel-dependent lactate racemase n=1 Tax=Ignisphaera aggregans TaxID=334771 RepID=A0A7C2VLF2_9CREN